MLKSFDKILEPDLRFENIVLAGHHEIVSSILLDGNPPDDVRNAFDRARNLMLYAYFYYEMLVNAEIQAFGAVELALRIKLNGSSQQTKQTLNPLIVRAREAGFLPNKREGSIIEPIDYIAGMRNILSHGTTSIHEPHMTEDAIRNCGLVIDTLFPKVS
jgi:hypothetical protein